MTDKIKKYFEDNGHFLGPHNPQSMLVFFVIVDTYTHEYTQKIPAIKLWRALTFSGLKESKEFVEELEEMGYMPLYFMNEEDHPKRSHYKYEKIVKDCRHLVPEVFAKLKLAHAKALLIGEPEPIMRHWWAVSNIIQNFREVHDHNG